MADGVAMRAAFGRLGLTDQASQAIVGDQGINNINEIKILRDAEIENLCKVVRRPGGMVANNANAITGGGPAEIPNAGLQVSMRAENNLKLAAYYLWFREKISRPTAAADITLPNVCTVKDLRDWEDGHSDVEATHNLINPKDWTKTMEALEEYLCGNLGVTKILLSYVVRDSRDVTADPAGGWPSQQDEMIGRAPILSMEVGVAAETKTPTFLTDNQRVWELLSSITCKQECWTYIKVAQRARDGRAAFLALKNHYLGPNNVNNLASGAKRNLRR